MDKWEKEKFDRKNQERSRNWIYKEERRGKIKIRRRETERGREESQRRRE